MALLGHFSDGCGSAEPIESIWPRKMLCLKSEEVGSLMRTSRTYATYRCLCAISSSEKNFENDGEN